ncbi:MAG: lytic transglycosylase domain-containing protein [Clostridia bacterium]|nr:lytic transglycosylase domain-containing protein [Clostridia bacterium]
MRGVVSIHRRTRVLLLFLLLVLVIVVAMSTKGHVDKQLYPRHYEIYVHQYAHEYDVPEPLVYAVIRTESDFDRNAVSSAGAVGLMQLLPDTYVWLADYHLHGDADPSALTDAKTNIRFGVYYLRWLYDRYGSWMEACAAYNAGPGNVDDWLTDSTLTRADGTLNPDEIPFGQTYAYVAKVGSAYEKYAELYFPEHIPAFESRTK